MSGQNFKEFESAAWEAKAARYDDTWGRVSCQAIQKVLDLAGVQKGTKLLDCGCGPGHLCHEARNRGAQVTGCDFSKAMVEIARQRYPGLQFRHEDAEQLSLAGS